MVTTGASARTTRQAGTFTPAAARTTDRTTSAAVQASAHRREWGEDEQVPVPERPRPPAVVDEHLGPRHREVHPPAPEGQADAGEGQQCRVDAPARLAVDDRVERRDGAE